MYCFSLSAVFKPSWKKLENRGWWEMNIQINNLWKWLPVNQRKGHTEEGGCRNWCSLCLMYRPACSGVFASWQRCLAHPEIHYRSVSSIHLNVALQLQITTNDPPPPVHPLPPLSSSWNIHLPSSFHYSLWHVSLSLSRLVSCFLSVRSLRIPHLSSHSSHLSLSNNAGLATCRSAQFKRRRCRKNARLPHYTELHSGKCIYT